MQSVHQNIPINSWQRVVLAVGSSFLALANPTRGDLVAVLSETTGVSSLGKIVSRMRETEEGQQLLKDKPIINSKNLNLDRLSKLPKDTFGYQYWSYLDTHKISPDTRMPIRFVPDPEMAYALLRYRQERSFLINHQIPWALKVGKECAFLPGVYFEKYLDMPLVELRKELRLVPAPLPAEEIAARSAQAEAKTV